MATANLTLNDNPLIAGFNGELAFVDPSKARTVETALSAVYGMIQASGHSAEILGAMRATRMSDDDDFWPDEDDWLAAFRPYNVRGGILQIPVSGVLLHNFPFQFGSFATGYDYIDRAHARGLADPNVNGIVLVENSPGGHVSGCFDLGDKIFSARDQKPITAILKEFAYSAAYLLACSCSSISVPRTGGVGSIGVVTSHVDVSKMLENMGVKITFISAPKDGLKTEGNPYGPLSKEALERLQSHIDELYGMFVSAVARNRGMEESAVIDTQADVFSATKGVELGLADSVMSFDDAFSAFAGQLEREPVMADVKEADHIAAVNAAQTTAKAEGINQGKAEGKAEGESAGRKAERERIAKIEGSDAAKKRPTTARELALSTDMDADAAITFLGKLPEEGAAAVEPAKGGKAKGGKEVEVSAFENAMQRGNPNLHAEGGDDEDGEDGGTGGTDSEKAANVILGDFARAGGILREPEAKGRRNN